MYPLKAVLHGLATSVIGRRRLWLVVWLTLLAAAVGTRALRGDGPAVDLLEALPPDQPYRISLDVAHRHFPHLLSGSDADLVLAFPAALTASDEAWLQQLVRRLDAIARQQAANGSPAPWHIRSHVLQPLLRGRLVSPGQDTVLVRVGYDAPYASDTSYAFVAYLEAMVHADHAYLDGHGLSQTAELLSVSEDLADFRTLPAPPPGLQAFVTGTAGLGRDRNTTRQEVHRRTTIAAVIAVLTVLLLVYRAPLAACVPLATIGVSAVIALHLMKLLASHGLPISSMQMVYSTVLIFGSGTDFALFWMSRFSEELGRLPPALAATRAGRVQAALAAYRGTAGGILSSAFTTILGLSMLIVSLFPPSQWTGPMMGLCLLVSLAASLTLMPAIAVSIGPVLFWPRRQERTNPRFWLDVAHWVLRRPIRAILLTTLPLAVLVWEGQRHKYRYDITGDTQAGSGFVLGRELVTERFGVSNLFSYQLLVELDAPFTTPTTAAPASPSSPGGLSALLNSLRTDNRDPRLADLARHVAAGIRAAGNNDVWTYAEPLGAAAGDAAGRLAGPDDLANYLSSDGTVLRFEVLAGTRPFSPEALARYRQTRAAVQQSLEQRGLSARLHSIGPTPYMANVQDVARIDEIRVQAAVVFVIALVIFALIRDWLLTILLLGVTLLAYAATLGLTALVFVELLGEPGIDWKIKIFSFVVLMAVGQDYNLFLVSRLLEERRRRGLRAALRASMTTTGRIISSCGLITAVSLGALMVSGMDFLQQMGLALAAGTLIDTFLIRPILLPAILLLLRRPHRPRNNARTDPRPGPTLSPARAAVQTSKPAGPLSR